MAFGRIWIQEPRHSETRLSRKRYTSFVARVPVDNRVMYVCALSKKFVRRYQERNETLEHSPVFDLIVTCTCSQKYV